MIKKLFFTTTILFSTLVFSQEKTPAFQKGEWLRYTLGYSGFFKAGTMTLELKEKKLNDKTVLHAVGKGWSSTVLGWFFKVDDTYESYFEKDNVYPLKSVRNISEGGYKMHRVTQYNQSNNTATVTDKIHKKDTTLTVKRVQDMLSTFYFLRNYDVKDMKPNDEIDVAMFFDYKTYPFKLKLLRFEKIKTKFGKIKTMVFRPIVKAGRVFKAEESVTVWITADDNKIPIKMRAELAVGSLRAELNAYKGLANPFEVIFD